MWKTIYTGLFESMVKITLQSEVIRNHHFIVSLECGTSQ